MSLYNIYSCDVWRLFLEGSPSFGKIIGIIVSVILTAIIPAGIMGGFFSASYVKKYPDRREMQ